MIEHADFFDEPKRMVQRKRVDERSEAQPLGALGYGGEKNARRGRQADGGRVVLGQVIGVKAGAFVGFDELEARLVKFIQRQVIAVEMIKEAEFHAAFQVT
jgi:hypothetical protein